MDPVTPWELVPVTALVVGVTLSALALETPWVHLAYRLPRMHAVIDTAVGLVSLLLAFLMYGRVRAFGQQRDFGIAFAVGFGGFVNLFAAVAQGVSSAPLGRFAVWTFTAGRLLVAFLFAIAALMPEARLERPARVQRFALVIAATFGAFIVVVGVVASQLPWSPDLGITPRDASRPLFIGPALLLGAQAVMLLVYLAAAAGFSRRRTVDGDIATWLASTCVLFALANFNYLTFPSIFSDWIYVGDVLRLGGVLLLFVGAAREISGYWTRSAALEERRRVAHDLHDGVAQELSYIAAMARRVEHEPNRRDAHRLADAAQHALDESRLVISTLVGAGDAVEQLALTARDAAHRYDLVPVLDFPEGARVPPQLVDPLSRILREAITNAGRHAATATTVRIALRAGDAVELIVSDDGKGFDPASTHGGFGIMSMRERAAAAEGSVTVKSRRGEGTTITARLPCPRVF